MPTGANPNEPARSRVRARGLAEGVTRAAMGLVIAVSLAMAGTFYLSSLAGPAGLIAFASAATD